MKKTVSLAIIILIAVMAQAQILNPVKFSSQLKTNGTAEAEIIFSGQICNSFRSGYEGSL